MKVITAILPVGTAVILWRSLPVLLLLPVLLSFSSHGQLQAEIAERERVQEALRIANEELETRVQERTEQFVAVNLQ